MKINIVEIIITVKKCIVKLIIRQLVKMNIVIDFLLACNVSSIGIQAQKNIF